MASSTETNGVGIASNDTDISSSTTNTSAKADNSDITKQYRAYIECDSCAAPNPKQRCARCLGAYYCSPNCQRTHWKQHGCGHKLFCVSIQDQKLVCVAEGSTDNDDDDDDATVWTIQKANGNNDANKSIECGLCWAAPIPDRVLIPGCKHAFCEPCLQNWHSQFHQVMDRDQILLRDDDVAAAEAVEVTDYRTKPCPACQMMDNTTSTGTDTSTGTSASDPPSFIQATFVKAVRFNAYAQSLSAISQQVERLKFFRLALVELDKILATQPGDFDMSLLCLKSTILVNVDPAETIKLIHSISRQHSEGIERKNDLDGRLGQVNAALDAGNKALSDRLLFNIRAWARSVGPWRCFRNPTCMKCVFPTRLTLAKAYEDNAPDDLTELAMRHYNFVAEYYNSPSDGVQLYREGDFMDILYQRQFCFGVTRILLKQAQEYDETMYDMALVTALSCFDAKGRGIPGVHQLVAKAQRGLARHGRRPFRRADTTGARQSEPCTIMDAVKTMYQGLLYEAPLDEANRQVNRAFLQELLDEMESGIPAPCEQVDEAAITR